MKSFVLELGFAKGVCAILGALSLVFVACVDIPNPGDTLTLSGTTLAVNEQARDLMLETVFTKDETGFGELMEDGLLFQVSSGTKAKFLKLENVRYNTFYKVRIEDGLSSGQVGWVLDEKVKR